MAKILGSWSAMKHYLEEEMLCESLRGRVRYNCTAYPNMDGCKIFEIYTDGKLFERFSWETVNSYFIKNGLKDNNEPRGRLEYWDGFHNVLSRIPPEKRSEYTDNEFASALEFYRSNPIKASLASDNPVIVMFALLDRRCGKRSLKEFEKKLGDFPERITEIYKLRIQSG